MTTVRRSQNWPSLGLSAIVFAIFSSGSLSAQTNSLPAIALPIDLLIGKAFDLEGAAKWDEALPLWCKVYGQDRQNEEANKHIQICLRRMFQAQRPGDQSLREKVLSLSHAQSLALYGEVLTTLHSSYVDRAKAAPARLFAQGLEEFLTSLNEPSFRKLHLADVRQSAIRTFQTRLREYMAVRAVDTVPDVVELVKTIAATAKRDLQMNKTSVVVLEFIGGACNSLDEYTAYLSPSELAAEMGSGSESSVVETGFLKEGVGYFRISHFRDTTPEEVDSAIASLKMAPQGMHLRAIVMDLRGNHGGLFSAAVQVVERFVPAGVIVTTQGRLDEFNKVYSSGAKMNAMTAIDLPLVVLVDGTTASAAEVLAGAFRDHRRATLVGTATYGKGSIQRVLQFTTGEELDDNGKAKPRSGGIRITLARFFSPNGQALNGTGVTPHVVEPNKSLQLEAALEQASRYLSGMVPDSPTMLR